MYQSPSLRPQPGASGPQSSANSVPIGDPAQGQKRHRPGTQPQTQAQGENQPQEDVVFDGKSLRKSVQRRTVDYNASQLNFFEKRPWLKDNLDYTNLQPDPHFAVNMLPPNAQKSRTSSALTTKWVSTSLNKVRCPVNVVKWTPEGRRLITGCSTGEFTLWNGLTFNFETILQAHESAVRAMEWSHNDNWMVTAEHNGIIKYWQSNMNNLKEFQAHESAIRDLSFSCTDAKFATCSDDSTIKVWDFNEGTLENTLLGHASDVKCIDWHPHKSLIASGSRDHMLKLWDPKTGKGVATLHNHKSSILSLEWNRNGNWLATTARDQLIKVFDIRAMKEFHSLRGHRKEVSTVAWHPHHERLFATGGSDGAILFWDLNSESPVEELKTAHDNYIWSLDWHPVGHILVSGSNDHTTRFWTRPRPGEVFKTKEARFHGNQLPPIPVQEGGTKPTTQGLEADQVNEDEAAPMIPGLGRAIAAMPLNMPLPLPPFPPGLRGQLPNFPPPSNFMPPLDKSGVPLPLPPHPHIPFPPFLPGMMRPGAPPFLPPPFPPGLVPPGLTPGTVPTLPPGLLPPGLGSTSGIPPPFPPNLMPPGLALPTSVGPSESSKPSNDSTSLPPGLGMSKTNLSQSIPPGLGAPKKESTHSHPSALPGLGRPN